MAGGSTEWRGRSVVSKVVTLLDAFDAASPELTLGELARRTGLPLSTAYRLVTELVEWGGLERMPGGGYRIGMRLWEIGALAPRRETLRAVALPAMSDLSEATLENVHLAVLDGAGVIYVEKLAGRRAVAVPTRRGGRLPLHATAAGKVLMAYAPESLYRETVAAGLRRFTPHTIIAPGTLRRALTAIRRTGIGYAREELTVGSHSVASAVLDADGAAVAALSVTLHPGRTDVRRLGPAVRTAALSVSRGLQHRPHPDLAPHDRPRAACRRRTPGTAARTGDDDPGHTGAVAEPRVQSRPGPPGAAPAAPRVTPTGTAPATRRAAVLGMPVEHSLSPVLHHAAYAALGLSGWRYDRYAVDEPGLRAFVDGLGPEWAGLSLTMPLKREALAVADEVDPDAAAIGAANTLVRRGTAWHAANTDVVGIVETLREVGVTTVGRAVVLGAGGTAQAALAALHRLGETAPTVLVRDPARAGALRATAERLGLTPRIIGGFPDPATVEAAVRDADVVISTLPTGAADALAGRPWDPATAVLDVIYTPWPTALAAAAAGAGCRIAGGLEVLLHQAVGQVELMTGRPGPTAVMRAALSAAAGERGPAAAQDTSRTGPAASGTARAGTVPEAR